jgi:antitoxin (DNA-binding transcriptional repressor) of toxin-antitoxin stability system
MLGLDMKSSVVDLRYRMKDVLKAIDRGETVTVLYRGKEKARLTPVGEEKRGVSFPIRRSACGRIGPT